MSPESKKVCISIAERPGTFGREFHNRGYSLLGLDYMYIPLKVNASELESMLKIVRDNCKGCSVSMPHKKRVYELVDERDVSAERTGAVNTILNQDGRLIGFNTDYTGAGKLLNESDVFGKRVVLLGAGGVAHALGAAVLDKGANLYVMNRTREHAESMVQRIGNGSVIDESEISSIRAHWLINATNRGMGPDETPLAKKFLTLFLYVLDAVVGDTTLIRDARALEKIVIPGRMLTAYQAADQFKIYTGHNLPQEFINRFANS